MSFAAASAFQILQSAFVVLAAPLLAGWVNMCRAWLQNRSAPGILLPYFTIAKLFHKDVVIAADASPLESETWLPVRTLLTRIKAQQLPPNLKLLLILDSNRFDVHWGLGQLYNGFAERLPEVIDNAAIPNLAVINSTGPGQVGWTSPRGHAGLDIAAPWGAPVRAAAAGRVAVATRAGGAYGTLVVIDHGDGLRTVYAHLSQLNVDPGESVERGELLGLVGSTGFSTGPHLHFEVLRNGALRDPIAYLP